MKVFGGNAVVSSSCVIVTATSECDYGSRPTERNQFDSPPSPASESDTDLEPEEVLVSLPGQLIDKAQRCTDYIRALEQAVQSQRETINAAQEQYFHSNIDKLRRREAQCRRLLGPAVLSGDFLALNSDVVLRRAKAKLIKHLKRWRQPYQTPRWFVRGNCYLAMQIAAFLCHPDVQSKEVICVERVCVCVCVCVCVGVGV
jgi:hypothetical protein